MPSMSDRLARYAARLFVGWLNERYAASFELSDEDDALIATDGTTRIGVLVAPLWDAGDGWRDRVRALEERLDAGNVRGPFVLWVPPKADLPSEEPAGSDFVQRVQVAAAPLPPGARTEVTFPVTVKMGKVREEGGYASVIGGMSRWWTRITENVQGTFHVDSSAVHRLTIDGESREKLWFDIGSLSRSVEVSQAVEFEVDEAWTLQRLPVAERDHGFAVVAAPPGDDPTEGIAVRRMARKRLAEANDALAPLDVDLRAVVLLASYEYAELEGAGATIKALDPALFSRLQLVSILADGELRPTFAPKTM
jgi:hypothetical protein